MEIKLPKKFDSILKGVYRSIVDNALAKFKHIYTDNKLEFFPDFTDHGINHIEEVLEASENIIDEESFRLLNERDIAILILSILLHDLGMHISPEGAKKLLSTTYEDYRVDFFDQKSWKDEWVGYFQEVKRFNDEQLKNVFGTSDQNINEPDLDNLDNYSRRLYGEFLRRKHHRLAHEIALGGFPTRMGEENIRLDHPEIDEEVIDIVGLVARSHGMPIRKAIDYLEDRYNQAWRTPFGIKAIFLMVVLRIADYLQIQSDRASKIVLKSKKLSSPISKREWEKHNSIKDINIKTADPERIFVLAKPQTSAIFLELVKLFDDIQSELDTSWAILGEAYGKDEDLKDLKIKFRRIRSILDDKEKFIQTVNYIPERVFFDADPSLLKLLIGPLYGEDPKYGVRELLQNAVDAIKEREYIKDVQGKVFISIEPIKKGKSRYEITIKDTGLGMAKDTIIHYFFKAGASFRKSMAWKKAFIDENEVKVQRTGRFGVGVLAVFLLGDDFELWTKYDSKDAQGFYCKASLGMTQVELLKDDCEVGTTIKIPLKDSVNAVINSVIEGLKRYEEDAFENDEPDLLEWFTWYGMDKPRIEFNIDTSISKAFKMLTRSSLISSNPDLPHEQWRHFSTNEYRSIQWRLPGRKKPVYSYYPYSVERQTNGRLACNGFKILKGYNLVDPSYNWPVPIVSVFDNNANFPLSLNRDYLTDGVLPFEAELLEHVSLEIINALLATNFQQMGDYFVPNPNILPLHRNVNLSEFVIVIGDEFSVLHPKLISLLGIDSLLQLWIKPKEKRELYNFSPDGAYQARIINNDSIAFYRQILEADQGAFDSNLHWLNLANHLPRNDQSSTFYMANSKFEYLQEGKRLSKQSKDKYSKRLLANGWSQLFDRKLNATPDDSFDAGSHHSAYPLIVKRVFSLFEKDEDFFTKTWKKYLGNEFTFPVGGRRPRLLKFRK